MTGFVTKKLSLDISNTESWLFVYLIFFTQLQAICAHTEAMFFYTVFICGNTAAPLSVSYVLWSSVRSSYLRWQREQTRCNRQTIVGTLSPRGRALAGRYLQAPSHMLSRFPSGLRSRGSGMLISQCNCLQIADYCYLSVISSRFL